MKSYMTKIGYHRLYLDHCTINLNIKYENDNSNLKYDIYGYISIWGEIGQWSIKVTLAHISPPNSNKLKEGAFLQISKRAPSPSP